ncbi:hypothetical protein ACFOLG_05670 [Vogesella facilis]|uniref:Uncharacterized protein n=1 Tax=Vogesella facilis TaxID=1655232 RepID=A0ABV7RBE4_9NEIS
MNEVTSIFWSSWRDSLQNANEALGFYCYGKESDPAAFSLWRDSDDQQLTPWMLLGDLGMIGVLHQQDSDLLLQLMSVSDDGSYPCRIGLMHLPSGRETGLIFDPEASERLIEIDWLDQPSWFVLTRFDETPEQHRMCSIYDEGMNCLLTMPLLLVSRVFSPQPALILSVSSSRQARYGLFSAHEQRLWLPCDYIDLFSFDNFWIGITPRGDSHIWDQFCQSSRVLPYVLTSVDGKLFAQQGGLWQAADEHGNVSGEFSALSLEALLAEPLDLRGLTLPTVNSILDGDVVARLADLSTQGGSSCKYEGLSEPFCDGYLDIGQAVLSPGQIAILLESRYDDLRWLVLPQDGAEGRRGVVWRLFSDTQAVGLTECELAGLSVLLESV